MADFFSKSKHDLSILDPSTGNTFGFICDRVEGKPAYAEYDGKSFVDLFSTSPTQTSTNPEEELVLGSETHHAGFGKEYYDSGDRKRYFESIGMDLSYEGQAIAGWSSTAVTATPVIPTIGDADMEDDDGSWTGGAQSDVLKNGGTYSRRIQNGTMTQSLTWDALFQSKTLILKVYCQADAASEVRIGVFDGVDEHWSSYHSGGGGWEQLTATGTMASNATELTLKLPAGASDFGYFDDATITSTHIGTGGVIGKPVEFNDKLYFPQGNTLRKLSSDGANLEPVYAFSVSITKLIPFQVSGTDYLMILLGTSTNYWYMTTAEVFTESNATDKTYQFGAWVKTTVPTMYANDGDNTIRSTVNPLNGGTAWSAQTVMGFSSDAFTWLTDKDGALLAWKEDIPYYLDSSGNEKQDLASEARSGRSSHSGKNGTIWQGEVFAPIGDQALLRVGNTNSWVQPSKFISNSSSFSGQVEAVAGDEEWLYTAIDNSAKVEILKFRDEVIDGITRQVWHPIHELTLTGVEAMMTSTVYKKRLWMTSTLASEIAYYLPLPTKYGDIINDAQATFKTDTYFIDSWLHGDFKSTDKALIKIEATLGHAWDALIYYECHMQKLGDSSWTDMGDLKGSATTRKHTLYRTVSTTSTMFRFKFVVKTDDTAKTPILWVKVSSMRFHLRA